MDAVTSFQAAVRIDTPEELMAFSHGGILPYVLRQLVTAKLGTKLTDTKSTKCTREHEVGSLRASS